MARTMGPVLLFCGVMGMRDYPAADWVMAWVRPASTQRNGALRGFNNWEPILTWGLSGLSNDVIICPNYRDIEASDHPTPKPLKLMRRLLGRCPHVTVADPFMGSGTTLIAAKECGRCAIGIEIEERYCEIAAKRLSQGVLYLRQPEQSTAGSLI